MEINIIKSFRFLASLYRDFIVRFFCFFILLLFYDVIVKSGLLNSELEVFVRWRYLSRIWRSKFACDTVLDTTHAEITGKWKPVINVYNAYRFFYRNHFVNTSQHSGQRHIDGTDEKQYKLFRNLETLTVSTSLHSLPKVVLFIYRNIIEI